MNDELEAQQHTGTATSEFAEMQRRTAQEMAKLKELLYWEFVKYRAGAYFGPLLRRMSALSPIELEDDLEAHLSPEEFRDLLLLDLLVRGAPRYREEAPEVWLAVEISAVIDRHDVERALRQAGYRAIPTVTGERPREPSRRQWRAGCSCSWTVG